MRSVMKGESIHGPRQGAQAQLFTAISNLSLGICLIGLHFTRVMQRAITSPLCAGLSHRGMRPCTASLTRREVLATGATLPFLQNMSTKPAPGVSATARDTHVKLNSGNNMPLLGLGTSQAQGDECETAVKKAIDLGYRVSHLLLWLFSLVRSPKRKYVWWCSEMSYLF